ncbi:MAG TPA: winged helix-turn-helix domain-containing protein [Polyangiaceae bacterium]|jgi:two-component system phosphate regulon response regulator PhoB|nr:winged helix-turn-helix domain-containing protein [Polyangiaceae bacterium]
MARVLVIEDEADLLEVLQYNLTQAGHRPFAAATGEAGLRLAHEVRPEVVLLDLMLPDVPGTNVAKALRREPDTQLVPIIMVTARAEEVDRVVGFELGADDYVVKPFSVRELMLRIDAVLRRGRAPEQRVIDAGELRIDREAHRVTVSGEEISLTALEFKLLVTLTERRERVQARGTLLSDVWAIDAEVASRTVDTHVKRLRDKLGAAGRFIETVRGVGYRFSETPGPEE